MDEFSNLNDFLQTAATKRCRRHMLETDEFVSGNSEGFVMDSDTITKAYSKMKNLCINISNEIQTDLKIHNLHIFPRYLIIRIFPILHENYKSDNKSEFLLFQFDRIVCYNRSSLQHGIEQETGMLPCYVAPIKSPASRE